MRVEADAVQRSGQPRQSDRVVGGAWADMVMMGGWMMATCGAGVRLASTWVFMELWNCESGLAACSGQQTLCSLFACGVMWAMCGGSAVQWVSDVELVSTVGMMSIDDDAVGMTLNMDAQRGEL